MTESYLSKLMNFANQAENSFSAQEKGHESSKCLPSFLLKDDEDKNSVPYGICVCIVFIRKAVSHPCNTLRLRDDE